MNKGLLALVMAIALLLCGCCICDTQMEQLQQRVTELENQLSAITVTEPSEPAPAEPATTEPASIESAPTEPAPTEPASDETNNMSKILDTQLNSDNPYDWKSVAECKDATLDHLLRCAKKCTSITYDKYLAYDIADRLVRHSNATGQVVEELCNSTYYRVWYLIASADCNDANSLIAVAKKCASITETQEYADLIANKLINHSEFTAQVAMELSNSKYSSVKNLAHQALESLSNG